MATVNESPENKFQKIRNLVALEHTCIVIDTISSKRIAWSVLKNPIEAEKVP